MHERYLQPSILFLGIAAILRPQKIMVLLYILVSLAFTLNLEKIIKYFSFPSYDALMFSSRLIAFMFFLVIILGTFSLYYKSSLKEDLLFAKARFIMAFKQLKYIFNQEKNLPTILKFQIIKN